MLMPAIVGALVVITLAAALVFDHLWLSTAGDEMRSAGEASALAALGELISDDLLREDDNAAARLAAARNQAVRVAGNNTVAGEPLELDGSPQGDIRFGVRVPHPDSGSVRFVETDHRPTAVEVTARRTRAGGNPVGLFFRGLTGQPVGDVVRRSQATASNSIVGLRPFAGAPVPMLPLAILHSDPAGVRSDTWQAQIEQGGGADRYRYDPVSGTVSSGGDGIAEIVLRSRPSRDDDSLWNVALLDVGTGLDADLVQRQVRRGADIDDFRSFDGEELRFDSGAAHLPAASTFDRSLPRFLRSVIGQKRICLLFDSFTPSGSSGRGTAACIKPVAGRVMSLRRLSGNAWEIVLQPCVITTRTALLETATAGSSGADNPLPASGNRYIYKLYLAH